MALSILVFWAGTKHYVQAPLRPEPAGFLSVVGRAVRRAGTGRAAGAWLDVARDQHPPEAIAGAKAVFRIMGVFAAVTLFWTLFDQKASSWVIQASRWTSSSAAGRCRRRSSGRRTRSR